MTENMTIDTLLQALEDHFDTLNRLAVRSLEDAVTVHRDSLKRYTAGVSDLQQLQTEAGDTKVAIKSKLLFHQANQEICNSLFTEISAETPLTAMLSDMKR